MDGFKVPAVGGASLAAHRAVIEACLQRTVPFFWFDPGTLLIAGSGVGTVMSDVTTAGWEILGAEGFELDGVKIHPRLDLIHDRERRQDGATPPSVVEGWGSDVCADLTLRPVVGS